MEFFTVFFVVQYFTDYDLLFVECLQHLSRIGLGNGNRIQAFSFEINDEAISLVVQHTHLVDVDDVGAVAAHQAAGIHAVVLDGLHLAAQHVARNNAAALVEHVDVVVLRLDVIQVIELDGQFQVAIVIHEVDDLSVLGHHLVVRLHQVALCEHQPLLGVLEKHHQVGDDVWHRQGDESDEQTLGEDITEAISCRLDLEIRNAGVKSRDDHNLDQQPQDIRSQGKMPQLLDSEGHQHTAAGQKEGTDTDESHRVHKVTVGAQLEPCGVGKRRVNREKHQGEQGGDNHIQRLPDGFCQTLRGLRYQSFGESHQDYSKIAAKL